MRVKQGALMRYSNQHIEEMKQYSKSIGLTDQLFEYPKTKEQADGLLLLQEDGFAMLSMGYIKMNFEGMNTPSRDQERANNKLQELIAYCEKINSSYALTARDQLEYIVLPPLSKHRTLSAERKVIKAGYVSELNELAFNGKSNEIAEVLIKIVDELVTRIK